jgi:hypothetical protein
MIKKSCLEGKFSGLKVAKGFALTHLLFMDDVLILGIDSFEEWIFFKQILDLFCQAFGMEVNCQKSSFLYNNLESYRLSIFEDLFGIPLFPLENGLRYLGFNLKPNDYRVVDWIWLVQKLEKKLGHWTF